MFAQQNVTDLLFTRALYRLPREDKLDTQYNTKRAFFKLQLDGIN